MTLIKGFENKPNDQGFNEHTVEWRGRKLKELTKKELINLVINQFAINFAMKQELEQTQKILQPNLWTPN